MAKFNVCVGILLVFLCVADGQSTTSEHSHCSYTFEVPVGDCSQTPGDDQLLESSVISLQAQDRLLASQLTDESETLRQEIATIRAGMLLKILDCVPL